MEILKPLLDNVLNMPVENFLQVGEIEDHPWSAKPGCFDTAPCSVCGELVFENAARLKNGKVVCQDCFE